MDEHGYQCTKCGNISYIDKCKLKLRDGIYYNIYCPCCKIRIAHLDIGTNLLEQIELYDVTLDERYYEYKTK